MPKTVKQTTVGKSDIGLFYSLNNDLLLILWYGGYHCFTDN